MAGCTIGLYYKAGSLKARCCVAGRERLYLYCRQHGILHAQIGERIVAVREGEIAGIERIAKMAQANGVNDFPPAYFCRRVYFALAGRAPFRHLVYPVPPSDGLGVHVTLDLAGRARFGPNFEWVLAVDYTVDPARADAFNAAVCTYWPELRSDALQPGYAGIGRRPWTQGTGR
jgi:L-2-hydroxyglutarate oxidase LhgO